MDVNALFENFSKQKIIVIGDLMIDAYLEGKVNRISPEAPVPIVSFSSREERLGGAANVALNLISLSASVSVCSVIGKDSPGDKMIELLEETGVQTDSIVRSKQRKTTIKTRVIGNNQQLLRVDEEQTNDISQPEEEALLKHLEKEIAKGVDAIIFEDYNKGVLTKSIINKALLLAQKHKVITTVDPKLNNFFEYKGVTLFKPNLKELKEGLKREFSIQNKGEFETAAKLLIEKITPKILLITLSENGVFIQQTYDKKYFPAHIRNIADVSGAGDTVISVATLCLCAGLNIAQTAQISNLSGGLVCEKVGVVAIDQTQLLHEVNKLFPEC